ncbi:glycerophosphoryl diester phosphodiesterase, partial [Vibrio sp. D173a]|uniref:glycerophosphodiester phosphodiesterase family protein n=1 Tax=Vibrio sp. D173a TaxID=2836349 RepID=UPI0025619C4D|nr:glycerophosphoryl diester phosphodiesterase [Vibrio sp. D173a]
HSLDKLLCLELYSIHIDHQLLDISIANEIKESGIILKIWTLNDPSKALGFYEMGVDNIITDMPNQF